MGCAFRPGHGLQATASGVELSRGVESRGRWGALRGPSRSRRAGRGSAPPWAAHLDPVAGGMFETGAGGASLTYEQFAQYSRNVEGKADCQMDFRLAWVYGLLSRSETPKPVGSFYRSLLEPVVQISSVSGDEQFCSYFYAFETEGI